MLVEKKILWETQGALSQLAEIQFEDEKLNYKVGRIVDAVQSIIKPLAKSYDKLVKKHGEEAKNDKGESLGRYIVPAGGEKEEAFLSEWEAVLNGDGPVKVGPEVDYKKLTLEQLKPYMKQLKARTTGELSRWLIEPVNEE